MASRCREVPLYRPIRREGSRQATESSILFSFDIEQTRRVKAGRRTNPGRENQRQAFTPAVILFISLPLPDDKPVPG